MHFYFKKELIQLLPEKAAFLPQHRMLLVADIHLGKASHFRKEGIIIPVPNVSPDLRGLNGLLLKLRPETVVFLGDLFHSTMNNEWLALHDFIVHHEGIRFMLTKGNHDILPSSVMKNTPLEVVTELPVGAHILCTHQPLSNPSEEQLNIAGHIHPGVLIKTKSRQHFRLPCFYYHRQCLILPAFGQLTGLYLLKKTPGVRIFPVFPSEVIEWT